LPTPDFLCLPNQVIDRSTGIKSLPPEKSARNCAVSVVMPQ